MGELGELESVKAGRVFDELREAGETALAGDQLVGGIFELAADMRYRGQEHTIPVPMLGGSPPGPH